MKYEIDSGYMGDVRSSDHVVVDIPDVSGYTGLFMAKADGVKVYVFCYEFGYVVCITDPDLTVVSCVVTVTHRELPELTKTPEVVVAEMLMDGTLVYIDALGISTDRKLPVDMHRCVSQITIERPYLIYRTQWDKMPSRFQLELEPVPNDGVVIANKFRTLRLKRPTVDLRLPARVPASARRRGGVLEGPASVHLVRDCVAVGGVGHGLDTILITCTRRTCCGCAEGSRTGTCTGAAC